MQSHPKERTHFLDKIIDAAVIAIIGMIMAVPGMAEAQPSRMTVGPFDGAPTIDGTLESGEWDRALAPARMCNWSDGQLKPRRAMARLGWTEERLYLLVVSAVPPDFQAGEQLPRDDKAIPLDRAAVECWIDPNRARRGTGKGDRRYYQLVLDSTGSIMDTVVDARGAPDNRWNGNWDTGVGIDPASGMLVNEISVPFGDLGVEDNVAGRTFGVALGYNFRHPFAQVQWAPMKPTRHGFKNPEVYPAVHFSPTGPTVQLSGLGDPKQDLTQPHKLVVVNPGTDREMKFSSVLKPGGNVKNRETISGLSQSKTITLPARGRAYVPLKGLARLDVTGKVTWHVKLASPDGKTIFFRDRRRLMPTGRKSTSKWDMASTEEPPRDPGEAVRYILEDQDETVLNRPDKKLNDEMLSSLSQDQLSRCLVKRGDPARLQRVLRKARAGKPVTLGLIGGSITHGSGASDRLRTSYAALIGNWWKLQFPDCELTVLNAGIGATGSHFGLHRAGRDLFPAKPDLVIVEFCVNDGVNERSGRTYEGLMRQILRQPRDPAVIAFTVFGNKNTLGKPHVWHEVVARHYNVPIVSARHAVSPEMLTGEMEIKDYLADSIHPTDAGHRMLAATLAHYIKTELQKRPKEGKRGDIEPVPSPLFTDRYDYGRIIPATDLNVTETDGYGRYLGKWWGGFPGDSMTFRIECSGSLALGYVSSSAYYTQAAEVQVDDREPVMIDAFWKYPFSKKTHREIATNLPAGTHTVTLRTVKSPTNKRTDKPSYYRGFALTSVLNASSSALPKTTGSE
jgi:hypothetical protein